MEERVRADRAGWEAEGEVLAANPSSALGAFEGTRAEVAIGQARESRGVNRIAIEPESIISKRHDPRRAIVRARGIFERLNVFALRAFASPLDGVEVGEVVSRRE